MRLGYVRRDDHAALPATTPGSYVLVMAAASAVEIEIGRLGRVALPAGVYSYSGSALRGLRGRLARHLRTTKRRHWHVDYLIDAAPVTDVWVRVGPDRLECVAAQALASTPGALYPSPGFGSSDCRCRSHLVSWLAPPTP